MNTKQQQTKLPHNNALTDLEFDQISRALLASIEATIDEWLQNDVIDIDAQRTGGLLELSFPGGSKMIINTQPPLHEIWLAARSGGYHFRWQNQQWVDREGQQLWDVLSRCATAQGGSKLQFTPI